ncbi:transketolase C-terminal domain-containing protein [Actinomadura meridiana]|uniref:3-methyl-2-oxobutanoate dehydrogenase (2-methylpropanoyl-transferring) n=1 Tax=Actinomadura meridiana TaxID=559626 RepID=A0ABP8BTL1_9ACTN
MKQTERVVQNLNRALHEAFTADDDLLILGEDILDPYGGAFKATRGLSTRFPDRVIGTPISENGIVGVANGLCLNGNTVIVEIMFADFLTLAFDQIVNASAKSVTMFGHRVPMHLVVRAPVGGHRGYGATHSQSPQKHFIGVPNLRLYELSPFHESTRLLPRLLNIGEPCILFEDKTLYGERLRLGPKVDDVFTLDFPRGREGPAWVRLDGGQDTPDCTVIATGGTALRALEAVRTAFVEHEIICDVIVPFQLHPYGLGSMHEILSRSGHIIVAEESAAGGTWGSEIAHILHTQLWDELSRPVRVVSSKDSSIPAAPHLERNVLMQADTILQAIGDLANA